MLSFDVVSLFTAIPVDRACEHIRNKLNKDTTLKHRTKLSIDDIIKLYVSRFSIAFLLTTRRLTNKFTDVLWVVL